MTVETVLPSLTLTAIFVIAAILAILIAMPRRKGARDVS